jgi:iron complex transport system ATP-binding protein
MRKGTIVADGPADRVVTSQRLTELYGVGIHVTEVLVPEADGDAQRVCFPIRSRRQPPSP